MKRERITYGELHKMRIKKHANECGIGNAVVEYKGEFPTLTESTVNGWLKKYHSQLWSKRAKFTNSYICKGKMPSLFT